MVDAVYDDPALHAEVDAFAAAITPAGWSNSLGQKLVQLTMPGVPDVYQGTELWDNSLVDPDNRRPVDFAVRRELLARLDGGWRAAGRRVAARRSCWSSAGRCGCAGDRPELFAGYRPVSADGPARRARAGLRPRRRGDRRGHPAAGRAGPPRRLGRHRAAAAGHGVGPTCSPSQLRRQPAGRSRDLLRHATPSRCWWRSHDRGSRCGRRTQPRVRLRVGRRPTTRWNAATDGWWRLDVPEAGPGTDYAFLLAGW